MLNTGISKSMYAPYLIYLSSIYSIYLSLVLTHPRLTTSLCIISNRLVDLEAKFRIQKMISDKRLSTESGSFWSQNLQNSLYFLLYMTALQTSILYSTRVKLSRITTYTRDHGEKICGNSSPKLPTPRGNKMTKFLLHIRLLHCTLLSNC